MVQDAGDPGIETAFEGLDDLPAKLRVMAAVYPVGELQLTIRSTLAVQLARRLELFVGLQADVDRVEAATARAIQAVDSEIALRNRVTLWVLRGLWGVAAFSWLLVILAVAL